ncbi:MAG: hypothetical protein K6E84_10360 [Lachnospiraceae bacterium]|nr:hypothetical protein [Lachnospiraceae bacterium]
MGYNFSAREVIDGGPMMEEARKTIDNWDHRLLEYPFVRKGMTVEEYEKEKAYYFSVSMEDLKKQRYKPLWKQREESNGGSYMSKTLDIDNNIDAWIPTLKTIKSGMQPTCPLCGSDDIDIQKEVIEKNIGFLLVSCGKCGRSGYFSRVDFNEV